MFKVMLLVRRKPGLSTAQFREYYEEKHIKLVAELLPPPLFYRRNYILDNDPYLRHITAGRTSAGAEDPIDAITEIAYDSREQAEAMVDIMRTTDAGPRIMQDEAKFVDRERLRFFVVEVQESQVSLSAAEG